jgi:hypothetical protein
MVESEAGQPKPAGVMAQIGEFKTAGSPGLICDHVLSPACSSREAVESDDQTFLFRLSYEE